MNEKLYIVLSPYSLSQGKNYTFVLSFQAPSQQNSWHNLKLPFHRIQVLKQSLYGFGRALRIPGVEASRFQDIYHMMVVIL
jgi:hypothetical protein